MLLNASSVLSLAPDEASAKAAKGLLSPAKWGASLGATERAVWGACQGSGSKPYQTQVDLTGAALSFKCSCPSRKFPCKHGLALMLLRADDAGLFQTATEPAWVTDWIDSRQQRAQKKQEKAEQALTDPAVAAESAASAAKREAARWQRIEAGVEDLERFLGDLLGRGLASLGPEQVEAWKKMASRMVDAQAPGLGDMLKLAAEAQGQGSDWPEQVLRRMGRLQLCIEAVRRRDSLPEATRHDLKAALGWAMDRDIALTQGERIADDWLVVGLVEQERDNGLTERRTWLVGTQTARRALVLDFTRTGQGFEVPWPMGRCVQTTLAFYPGGQPLRAVVAADMTAAETRDWPGYAPEHEWNAAARQLAANPFAPLTLLLLTDVAPARHGDGWWLRLDGDPPAHAVPLKLTQDQGWDLLASATGLPLKLAGEWDGQVLRPTSAWSPEGLLCFDDKGGR